MVEKPRREQRADRIEPKTQLLEADLAGHHPDIGRPGTNQPGAPDAVDRMPSTGLRSVVLTSSPQTQILLITSQVEIDVLEGHPLH